MIISTFYYSVFISGVDDDGGGGGCSDLMLFIDIAVDLPPSSVSLGPFSAEPQHRI